MGWNSQNIEHGLANTFEALHWTNLMQPMGFLGPFLPEQILTAPPASPKTQQIQAQPTVTFTKSICFHTARGEVGLIIFSLRKSVF